MIVSMKKISLLVLDKYREESLLDLRRLGLLHIKYIKSPSSSDIDSSEKKIEDVNKALLVISNYLLRDYKQKALNKEEASSLANQIISLDKEKEDCLKRKEDIQSQISWYNQWGVFSLTNLRELASAGINIRLYKCLKKQLVALSKTNMTSIIKKQAGYYYVAVVSLKDKPDLDIPEVSLPEQDFQILKKELETIKNKISSIDNLLKQMVGYKQALSSYLGQLKKTLDFSQVKSSMQEEGEIVYLQGFIPAGDLRRLVDLANKKGWAYLIQEPDSPQEVPTLIKNPRWLKIIEPVFKFMGTLPGYNEYDISFSFLLFFSIFFALLIGDAGYGLLFLVFTYLIRKRLPHLAPEPFMLMYVLSFTTVLWGVVSGTWFGFEKIAQLPFLEVMVVDRVNSFIEGNQSFMMYICFLIGALHLSLAHSTIALKIINSLKALAQIGWILIIWSLFFLVGKLVLGKALFEYTGIMFFSGICLVLLFSRPQRNIFKGIGITLGDLPFRIIGSFSDIISYLRLFAVGYATLALANACNNMAASIGFSNIFWGFLSACILFIGHSLNIILGLLAVIVHGIRLNMLEFSSHLGMQWSGIEYKPFKE